VNNPFLSLLILISIALSNIEAGLGCCLGGLVATATELLLGLHPWSLVENGVAPFNGALIGSVIPSLYPLLFPHASDCTMDMWMAVLIGAVAR
jgi:urea transporter